MLGSRKRWEARAQDATGGQSPAAGDDRTRTLLADAIAQIESTLPGDAEPEERLESSPGPVSTPEPDPAYASDAGDVNQAIEQVTQLFTDVVDRLEADTGERRLLQETLTRLAQPLPSESDDASRVIGGTVFPSPATRDDGDEINIIEDPDDSAGGGRDAAPAYSAPGVRSVLDGLTGAAKGRGMRVDDDSLDALTSRANIAVFTGECGDGAEALRLCRALLADQVRVLGPDHPATLTTRANIAAFTGECGDLPEALRLSRELLLDRVRVLGPDHPDTLTTRSDTAVFAGESGDVREALRLSCELLLDRVRVLGADHPDTLTTRSDVAVFTGECGNAREALRLYRELLPDQERVLGVDHPDTAATREDIDRLELAVSAS